MPSIKQLINLWYVNKAVAVDDVALQYYIQKLYTGTPFTFSRFGDGEWAAILGKKGENCDGHFYFPQLGERLRQTLIDKKEYIYALQNAARRSFGKEIYSFVKKHSITVHWHHSDVFHYANREGKLFPLINQLRNKHVVVIGPDYLRALDGRVFRYRHFIDIPRKNCFLETQRIKAAINEYEKNVPIPKVYAFSASMATNVIIHELYSSLGRNNWLVDFGSLWDIYVDNDSRAKHLNLDWGMLVKKNLNENC